MYGDWEWWNNRVHSNYADYGHKFQTGVYNTRNVLILDESHVWNQQHRDRYDIPDLPLGETRKLTSGQPTGDLGWTMEQRMAMRDTDYDTGADSSPPTERREQR